MKLSVLNLFLATLATSFHVNVCFINQYPRAFHRQSKNDASVILYMAQKVGIFFGTSTGSTEEAAYGIMEALGPDIISTEPIEIDSLEGKLADTFSKYESLIVGTPTWNTGADTERSGTGWDELYYGEMQDLKIEGKNVAVFGLGDSVSYCENYADASGELHDVFEKLGCKMHGYISQEGYVHESSKAIRGDKFCGLLLDAVNQEEMTEDRIKNWVAQLIGEGFLESTSGDNVPAATVSTSAPAPVEEIEVTPSAKQETISAPVYPTIKSLEELEKENAKLRQMMEENSLLLEESIIASGVATSAVGSDVFTPHFNPKTKRTMWTSADGKSCYFTTDTSAIKP